MWSYQSGCRWYRLLFSLPLPALSCSHQTLNVAIIVCEPRSSASDSSNDSVGSRNRNPEGDSFKVMNITS
jgi:hypothetical protein